MATENQIPPRSGCTQHQAAREPLHDATASLLRRRDKDAAPPPPASSFSLKLRSLRVNVGQLLATIIPDFDLQQMNYNVDVVDKILGQVVAHMHEISSS